MDTYSDTFGHLLDWQITIPRREQTAQYDGRRYSIEFFHTSTVRRWDRLTSAKWFLTDPEVGGYGDRWPHGYPLGRTIHDSRRLAELQIICPWVTPNQDMVMGRTIPSIARVLGTGYSERFGSVRCYSTNPHHVWIYKENQADSRIDVVIQRNGNPVTAPIFVKWVLNHHDGSQAAYETWPEVYLAAEKL